MSNQTRYEGGVPSDLAYRCTIQGPGRAAIHISYRSSISSFRKASKFIYVEALEEAVDVIKTIFKRQ